MNGNHPGIPYYRRGEDSRRRERVMGGDLIARAYREGRGNLLHRLLFGWSLPSRLLGWYLSGPWSRGRIADTVEALEIDPGEFARPLSDYRSFNDWFTRHLRPECRPCAPDPKALASPADARTFVFPRLAGDTLLPVKGAAIAIPELLDDAGAAADFTDGAAAVFRLCPADYHRYHFPCAARVLDHREIPGRYHSVNPAALARGIDIFTRNRRSVTLLDSEVFGRLAMVEVGAFGVGSIVQTWSGQTVAKMQEKGYFQFGGSSIVLLCQAGRIEWPADLIEHSAEGYETLLHAGETINRTN